MKASPISPVHPAHCIFSRSARPSIVASLFPRSLVLLLPIACNPIPPGSEPGTTTDAGTTSGETDGISSSSAASAPTTTSDSANTTEIGADTTGTDTTLETSTTTEAVSTTSGDPTMEPPSPTSWTTDPGDDTTEGFTCNWKDNPDAEGFCPKAAAPNASLSGTTPLGPINFKFAYFGLLDECGFCPYASGGTVAFFNEPGGPEDPGSDSLTITHYLSAYFDLTREGEHISVDPFDGYSEVVLAYTDVHVPDVAETNPPLDADSPPTLSGKLSITGGGWNVSGEFTATLCRPIETIIYCE